MRACYAALAIGLLLAACGDAAERPEAEGAVVSDSAGVRVITLAGRLADAPLEPVELLRSHGFGEGEYGFTSVDFGTLLPDGTAFVADDGSREVIAVEPHRDFRVVLRNGQGPSEVRRPIGLSAADSTTVWLDDDGNSRLTLLSREGVVRSVSVLGRPDLGGALRLRGVDAKGRLMMSTSSFRSRPQGPWTMQALVHLDPATLTADTTARSRLAQSLPGPTYHPFLPFGWATAAAGRWVTAWGDEPELRWLNDDGTLRQIVRWARVERVAGSADLERFRAWSAADLRRVNPGLGETALAGIVERSMARIELDPARPMPQFRDIIGDDRGNVWLEDYEVGTQPTRGFTIVRAEDGRMKRIEFPTPVQILDIRGSLVLAAMHDELDRQAIGVFRVGGEDEEVQ